VIAATGATGKGWTCRCRVCRGADHPKIGGLISRGLASGAALPQYCVLMTSCLSTLPVPVRAAVRKCDLAAAQTLGLLLVPEDHR